MAARIEVAGPLAVVTVDCGAGSSYLNPEVLAGLESGLDSVAKERAVKRVCLRGRDGAFINGVDVACFVNWLEVGDVTGILDFTRRAHRLLARLAAGGAETVAWVEGAAIGAGLEIALACDRIVAAGTAKFLLPETGLGIYPGMGGTQRLPRRVGPGLAKWLIYTGAMVPAEHAQSIGLVDAIAPSGATASEALAALDQAGAMPHRAERFDALEELFGTNSLAALLDPAFPQPSDAQGVRALVQLRSKAPVALRLAEQVIDRGLTMSLAAGIDEEFSHLAEVFATQDARTGLKSVGATARPVFVGR
jgi:enoyl-CoA hydratase/3-hydroxyacyl-CoA dehydrogenase